MDFARSTFRCDLLEERSEIRHRFLDRCFIYGVGPRLCLRRPAVHDRHDPEVEIERDLRGSSRRIVERDVEAVDEHEQLATIDSFDRFCEAAEHGRLSKRANLVKHDVLSGIEVELQPFPGRGFQISRAVSGRNRHIENSVLQSAACPAVANDVPRQTRPVRRIMNAKRRYAVGDWRFSAGKNRRGRRWRWWSGWDALGAIGGKRLESEKFAVRPGTPGPRSHTAHYGHAGQCQNQTGEESSS